MDFVLIYLIGAIMTFYLAGFSFSHEKTEADVSEVILVCFCVGIVWPIGLLITMSSLGERTGKIRFYLESISKSQKTLADKTIDIDLVKAKLDSLIIQQKVKEEVDEIVKDLKEGD
jgi:hypothetical protein